MTDLDQLRELLHRAGRQQGGPSNRDNEDTSYSVDAATGPWPECSGCHTALTMTGQWTGEFLAHFAEDGSIRHIWISGD